MTNVLKVPSSAPGSLLFELCHLGARFVERLLGMCEIRFRRFSVASNPRRFLATDFQLGLSAEYGLLGGIEFRVGVARGARCFLDMLSCRGEQLLGTTKVGARRRGECGARIFLRRLTRRLDLAS